MEITNIKLENYKGISNLDSQVFHRTMVSGKNASGKTTVADAVFDIMCDKLSDGTSPTGIRPHNANGEVEHNIPVTREIDVCINGNTYTICKKTEEKWRKPHGSTELVYDGSKTTFSIDGFEKQLKDYTEWMTDHVAKPELVSFYMNPQVFINSLRKSTTEARKLLEKVSGFSVNDFVSKNEKYQEVARLIGENSIEDVLKQFRRNLKNQKAGLETAQKNLSYEKGREVKELSPMVEHEQELREQLDSMLRELEEAKKSFNAVESKRKELNEQIASLVAEKTKFEHGNDMDSVKRKSEAEMEKLKAISSLNTSKAMIDEAKSFISAQKANISAESSKIDQYKVESMKTKCQLCGQMLPEAKVKAISKKYVAEIERLNQSISKRTEAISAKEAEIKNLEANSMAATESYNHAMKSLMEIEAESKTRKWEHDDALNALRQELANLGSELYCDTSDIQSGISEIESKLKDIEFEKKAHEYALEEKTRLVSELADKVKEEAGACAEIERKIDLVQQFSIEKNQALADKINPYFNHFYFKFIEFTELEQNPVETCRIIEKSTGTDYMNGLNHGSKIICEAEMVSGFQKMNNISLPVILDDSESVDTDKIPNLEQQTLVLRRVDDKPLTIEEITA